MDIADQADKSEEMMNELFNKRMQQNTHQKGTEYCVACHKKISPQRKQAAPESTRCLACQSAFENKTKRGF